MPAPRVPLLARLLILGGLLLLPLGGCLSETPATPTSVAATPMGASPTGPLASPTGPAGAPTPPPSPGTVAPPRR